MSTYFSCPDEFNERDAVADAVNFFATKRDLGLLLTAVEVRQPLRYVKAGRFMSSAPTAKLSWREIPKLGVVSRGDLGQEARYLMTEIETSIFFCEEPRPHGRTQYVVRQSANPRSVGFWPGGKRYRLDSYSPRTQEIVSRKGTQFADIEVESGVSYVREAAKKYAPGTKIANVPSSKGLVGQKLQGRLYLEVPIQINPIPETVLNSAANHGVTIRDVTGKVH